MSDGITKPQYELTEQERREIAGRSRTLHERLEGPSNDVGGTPPIDSEEILDEWKGQFRDEDAFRERLEREGFTEETIREQIAATHWPGGEPFPDWIGTLETILQHIQTTPTDDRHTVTISEDTPFAELMDVLVVYAFEQLPDDVDAIDVASPMAGGLKGQLQDTFVRPLYVEFKSYVEYHDPELAKVDPDEVSDPSTAYYEEFIDAMFEHGFKNLCLEYPVLARQLVRLVDHWNEAVVEVYRRLRSDQSALRERFGVSGEVTTIEPLADDVHAGGRIPVRVSFESGDAIYKPRSVDGGVAFYTILDRLDEHLSIPSMKTPKYISRDGYSWMETIEYRDPADEAAVERYYERAGILLCVGYLLNFTDCQLENLIVEGDNPMIVDGETLFHPHIDSEANPIPTEIYNVVNETVLLTALLPWSVGDPREPDKKGLAAFMAGFGSESGQTQLSDHSLPAVKAVNTDVMSVGETEMTVGLTTNTPTLDDEDRPPREHVDAIIRAFEETYETIQELHADGVFLTEIADPELIGGIENRLVYRATMHYRRIRQAAVARNPLRDGARLTVEFEELAAPFFDGRIETGRHWQMYEAERRALRRLDVPRFTSCPDQRTVFHDGEPLDVKADESGYERCRQRLDAMDSADIRKQVWFTRQVVSPETPDVEMPSAPEVTEELLRREAVELFDDVIDSAIDTEYGEGWVSMCPVGRNASLVPANHSLYWGRGGIALTAAALYDDTGQERYREMVTKALDPIIEELAEGGRSIGSGGTRGIGSVIYTLSVIAELLDDSEYREWALKATHVVTEDLVANDKTIDVMEGSAGTLLGLLAYYDRYGGSEVLGRARVCGERLLETRIDIDGYRVWKTSDDDMPLTGFAHGSNGIAYALARLGAATDESRYVEAVREALRYESSLYEPSRNNWKPSFDGEEFQDRWCHGRSGMALGRIGIGERLDDETLLEEANAALSVTAEEEASHLDNICCGNFGRIEAMLVGSRRLDGEFADAVELAGRCLARREREGTLSLAGHSESFVNPTFFDGITGAAYTLLRLKNPDRLPCVLLLE